MLGKPTVAGTCTPPLPAPCWGRMRQPPARRLRAKPSRLWGGLAGIWEGTVLPFVVACPPHTVRQTGVPHAGAVHP